MLKYHFQAMAARSLLWGDYLSLVQRRDPLGVLISHTKRTLGPWFVTSYIIACRNWLSSGVLTSNGFKCSFIA